MQQRQMLTSDVKAIIWFNTRMGMFICPSDRANVVAFLHGYEYGRAGECHFTESLSQHIASRYRVKADALGWSHQIARLAERQSLDWLAVYQLVSSEVLSAGLKGPPLATTNASVTHRKRSSPGKKRH